MIPKIVFLDLEGTLIRIPSHHSKTNVPASMWTTLSVLLGEECFIEEEKSKQEWVKNPNKTYLEWMDETVRIFQRHGLNKEKFEELLSMISIRKGVNKFCKSLLNDGCKISIITGALKGIGEIVQIETKAHHLFSGCELYFSKDGSVRHWNLLPSDYKGKLDFMRLLINEYEVSAKDCVFIGDGINDIHLAKEVGLSIGYNAQIELQNVVNYSVTQEDHEENFYELYNIIKNYKG